jgi:mRNA-degrading endonuclease RelE of RelBE toxin-antitoxin system
VATTRILAEAQKEFYRLPRAIQTRIASIFERLHDWPKVSGAKPLRGSLAGHYRIRTGHYRVQFFIDKDGNPVVEKLGHRDGFYE